MKKYLGEILLTIGSGVFVYNLFNISYSQRGTAHYLYTDNTLGFLALGGVLVVSGVLIIRNKK